MGNKKGLFIMISELCFDILMIFFTVLLVIIAIAGIIMIIWTIIELFNIWPSKKERKNKHD